MQLYSSFKFPAFMRSKLHSLFSRVDRQINRFWGPRNGSIFWTQKWVRILGPKTGPISIALVSATETRHMKTSRPKNGPIFWTQKWALLLVQNFNFGWHLGHKFANFGKRSALPNRTCEAGCRTVCNMRSTLKLSSCQLTCDAALWSITGVFLSSFSEIRSWLKRHNIFIIWFCFVRKSWRTAEIYAATPENAALAVAAFSSSVFALFVDP